MSANRPSFEEACRRYPMRYTMDHVPTWALCKAPNSKYYYAPQYASDREWYDHTLFPGEEQHPDPKERKRSYSRNPSWPLGTWLVEPPRNAIAKARSATP